MDIKRKKELLDAWKNRCPEMGVISICCKITGDLFLGISKDTRADFNSNRLIIDDLGAERNTEYALEQMFSIIDSRYRCNKPLIVTTNLKLDELKRPPDLAHARIYDRILERCAPILFAGKNFREDNAASTKAVARQIITSTAASHRQTATEKGEL